MSKGAVDALAKVVQAAMAAMILANYPFTMFGAMQNIEQIVWGDEVAFAATPADGGFLARVYVGPKQAAMRSAFVGLTVVVAGALPDFGFLTALTGCFSNALLVFTLPPMFHLYLYWDELWHAPRRNGAAGIGWRNWLKIIVDLVFLVGGTLFSLVSTALLLKDKLG